MLLIGVAALFLFILFPNVLLGQSGVMLTLAEDLIISFEGFIPVSKWDYKQYSWGYGTAAPGPGLSITESEARQQLRSHIEGDYNYLNSLITVSLNPQQWAALLSFCYNEGRYNADNLVTNINNQDIEALGNQWALYNKVTVNGVKIYSSDLAKRRADEWDYFVS